MILIYILLGLILFLPLLYAGLTLIYLVQRRGRIARGLPPDAGSPYTEPPSPMPLSEDPPSRLQKLPSHPSSKPYGQKFAMLFTQWLSDNRTFVRAHPYAACTGFHIDDDDTIVYGDYSDGYPFATFQHFPDLDSFAQWLARQSDQSLHKEGCECVSHSRLQKALRGQSYFGY